MDCPNCGRHCPHRLVRPGGEMRQDAGFCEFYEANYARTVALVTALLGDRHEAQDVAQEAFARALARGSRLGSYELPEAWVRKVAVRIAIDSTRRVRRAIGLSVKLTAQRQAPEPAPEESLTFSPLGGALMRLPMREREVLVLHYLADLPVQTIARDCGLPSGTVKARLAAGRRRLERELALQGTGVPDAGGRTAGGVRGLEPTFSGGPRPAAGLRHHAAHQEENHENRRNKPDRDQRGRCRRSHRPVQLCRIGEP